MSKVALVTGANTGIGYEVVRGLLRETWTVYLGARNVEKGEAAAEALSSEGNVCFLRIDTTDESTFHSALAQIEKEQGRLDVLVNNAGAAFPGTVLDIDPDVLRRCLETNLHGPMRLTQLAVPLIQKSRDGRIVNVSSSAGRFEFFQTGGGKVEPGKAPYGYGLSKAGMNAATVLFAAALKNDGIKVNACNPGYVSSLVSRFLGTRSPAEGAEIVLRLATEDRSDTGKFYDYDGSELTW